MIALLTGQGGINRMDVLEWLPGLRSIAALKRADIPREFGAALGVAAIAVPGALAMAKLMGVPPQTGLYAAMVGTLGYALFGPSSRYLIVGPDTATCLVLAASITHLGAVTLDARAEMASSLTLLVGLGCMAAALLRLGFIANMISHPVLVGYMAGISLTLFISQLPGLTGVDLHSPGLLRPLIELVRRNTEIDWAGFGFGLFLVALLRAGKAFAPRIPGPAVVVVIAIAASALFDFRGSGIELVGSIPSGLPHPRLPSFDAGFTSLIEAATGVLIVSFSSGILTARAFGREVNARSKPNRELTGFGAADIAAGLFQSWAVTGADSRTAVALSSGGRSALVGVLAVVSIAIVALFLTRPLALLPITALSAILVSASIDLFDAKGFAHLAKIDRFELLFALIAAAGVIWIGVLPGVIIAVVATFAHLIRLASRPRDGVMGRVPGSGELVTLRRDSRAEQSERILVYLFEASILFVNADYFGERVRIALRAQPETRWLVLDTSAMMLADSSAVETLVGLKASLDRKGIMLLLGGGHGRFREILERSGLVDLIGAERIFVTPHAALTAAEALRDGASEKDRFAAQ